MRRRQPKEIDMAHYMPLLHQAPNENRDLPREKMMEMIRRYMAWASTPREKGKIVGGEKLSASGGRHIRMKDGRPVAGLAVLPAMIGKSLWRGCPRTVPCRIRPPHRDTPALRERARLLANQSRATAHCTEAGQPRLKATELEPLSTPPGRGFGSRAGGPRRGHPDRHQPDRRGQDHGCRCPLARR